MDLSEGTAWVYWMIDQDRSSLQPVARDTLITWVEKELRRPGNTILIDPLVNLSRHPSFREIRDDPQALARRLKEDPVRLPFDSFHLPAQAWYDSTRFIEHQLVRVAGPVCQIEARGDSSQGKYPHYVANSSAGLIDLTSWIWLRDNDTPRPVYRPQQRMADLIVPTPRSRIGGWNTGQSGWVVTTTDTLITVPFGTFTCVELSYYQRSDSDEGPSFEEYCEYWTPGVGLIAWIDNREGGDGHWVLAEYGPGAGGDRPPRPY